MARLDMEQVSLLAKDVYGYFFTGQEQQPSITVDTFTANLQSSLANSAYSAVFMAYCITNPGDAYDLLTKTKPDVLLNGTQAVGDNSSTINPLNFRSFFASGGGTSVNSELPPFVEFMTSFTNAYQQTLNTSQPVNLNDFFRPGNTSSFIPGNNGTGSFFPSPPSPPVNNYTDYPFEATNGTVYSYLLQDALNANNALDSYFKFASMAPAVLYVAFMTYKAIQLAKRKAIVYLWHKPILSKAETKIVNTEDHSTLVIDEFSTMEMSSSSSSSVTPTLLPPRPPFKYDWLLKLIVDEEYRNLVLAMHIQRALTAMASASAEIESGDKELVDEENPLYSMIDVLDKRRRDPEALENEAVDQIDVTGETSLGDDEDDDDLLPLSDLNPVYGPLASSSSSSGNKPPVKPVTVSWRLSSWGIGSGGAEGGSFGAGFTMPSIWKRVESMDSERKLTKKPLVTDSLKSTVDGNDDKSKAAAVVVIESLEKEKVFLEEQLKEDKKAAKVAAKLASLEHTIGELKRDNTPLSSMPVTRVNSIKAKLEPFLQGNWGRRTAFPLENILYDMVTGTRGGTGNTNTETPSQNPKVVVASSSSPSVQVIPPPRKTPEVLGGGKGDTTGVLPKKETGTKGVLLPLLPAPAAKKIPPTLPTPSSRFLKGRRDSVESNTSSFYSFEEDYNGNVVDREEDVLSSSRKSSIVSSSTGSSILEEEDSYPPPIYSVDLDEEDGYPWGDDISTYENDWDEVEVPFKAGSEPTFAVAVKTPEEARRYIRQRNRCIHELYFHKQQFQSCTSPPGVDVFSVFKEKLRKSPPSPGEVLAPTYEWIFADMREVLNENTKKE